MYLKLMKIADKNAQEFKLFLKYSEEIGFRRNRFRQFYGAGRRWKYVN